MSVLRNALLLAALMAASPAPAAIVVTLGDALLSRPVDAADSLESAAASQTYFDIDALLTLGALAVASGALGAAALRPRASRKSYSLRAASLKAQVLRPRDAA